MEKAIEAGNVTDAGTKGVVSKLHTILRPYVLRRLKADVEKQLPAKKEHVVHCRLSKRQRFLYDEFMSRAETREKLSSGNFLSISNCLMQLRKACPLPLRLLNQRSDRLLFDLAGLQPPRPLRDSTHPILLRLV